MDNKYTDMLIQKHLKAESDLILMAMPDKATLSRCSCIEHGQGGKRVYSFEGKPFLELYPVTFETIIEDGSYKIKTNQEYRIIKEQE